VPGTLSTVAEFDALGPDREGIAMKVIRETLTLVSEQGTEFLDITKRVQEVLGRHQVREGILLLNSLHTTVAVFVNEFQAALLEDLKAALGKLIRVGDGYRHDDPRFSGCERGNAHSHLRAMLLGRSVALGVSDGELSLGRFQSIICAELDGPRERSLDIQLIGV